MASRSEHFKWQIDTMFGPHIKKNGTAVQTQPPAFIDGTARILDSTEVDDKLFYSEHVKPI